ncbi:DUF5615 family PIN-like protein [Candidatus Woesearchaeota archaeon]|nr:DUF5615 family PIN-like protein [Candidatus Woesearchaeota archaeon]
MDKIKFIVDESVDFPVVDYLRGCGYNVISVAEDFPSLNDIEILKIALKENRILLVNDKDFGTLVFKEKLKARGVVLFRLWDQSSKAKIKALKTVIDNHGNKLSGSFTVISKDKVRIRKL